MATAFPSVDNPFTMKQQADCKTIYFVRHAEGIHNRDSREIPNFHDTLSKTMAYWDAPLTSVGEAQGEALAEKVATLKVPPELVVVSPLRRAIHTAQLGFRPEGNESSAPPFLCTELARERISFHTCDGRRRLTEITEDYPFVDFSEVDSEEDLMWEQKEDVPDDGASVACATRAVKLLEWLQARPEQTIAVVSHWVFYTHLFRLFEDKDLQTKFGNAEMRPVVLCSNEK